MLKQSLKIAFRNLFKQKLFTSINIFGLAIGMPVSFYLMNEWLSDFAYRIDINWIPFGFSLLLSLLISLVTVSSQALRAATANPVDSLKNE